MFKLSAVQVRHYEFEHPDDGTVLHILPPKLDTMEIFLGREGETTTVLRPTGMAEFDGVKLNVLSEGEFIPAGVKVRIVRVEGSRILVHKV